MTSRKQERSDVLAESIHFFELLYEQAKATEHELSQQLSEQLALNSAARALAEKMGLPQKLEEEALFWEKLAENALLTEELQEAAPGFKRSAEEATQLQQLVSDSISDEDRLAIEQETHRENLSAEKIKKLSSEYSASSRACNDFERQIKFLERELEKAKLHEAEKEAAQHFLDSISSAVQNTSQLPSEGIKGIIDAAGACDLETLPEAAQNNFASLLPGVSRFLEKSVDNFYIWAIDNPDITDLLLDDYDLDPNIENTSQEDEAIKALVDEVMQGPQEALAEEEKTVWIKQQDKRITFLIKQKLQESTITREDWNKLLLAQSKIKAMLTTFEVIHRADESNFLDAGALDEQLKHFSERLAKPLPENIEDKLEELDEQLVTLISFLNNPLLKTIDRERLNKKFLDVQLLSQTLNASSFYERLLALHEKILRKEFSDDTEVDESIEEKLSWIKKTMEGVAFALSGSSINQQDRALAIKIYASLQTALQVVEAEKITVLAAEEKAEKEAETAEKTAKLRIEVERFYDDCNQVLSADSESNILEINNKLSTCDALLENPQLTAADSLWVLWMQYNLQSKYAVLLPAHQDLLHKKIISFFQKAKKGPPDDLCLDEKIEWVKNQNAHADSLLRHPIPAKKIDMIILDKAQGKLRDALTPLMQERYGPAGDARADWIKEKTDAIEAGIRQLEAVDLSHLSGSLVEQQEQLKHYLAITASILSNPVIKIAENAARYEAIQIQEDACIKAYQANIHVQTDALLEEVLSGGPISASFEEKLVWLRDRIALVKQLGEGVVEPSQEDKEVLHAIQNELEETLAAGEAWIPAEEMTSDVTLTSEEEVEAPIEQASDIELDIESDIEEDWEERTDKEALSQQDTPSLSPSSEPAVDMSFEEVSEVEEKSNTDEEQDDTVSEGVSSSDEEDLRDMPLSGPPTPERLMRSVSDIAENTTPGFTQKKESSPTAIARDISPPLSPDEEEKTAPKVQSRPVRKSNFPKDISRMETTKLWHMVQILKETLQTPPGVTSEDKNIQDMLSLIKEQDNGELTESGVLNIIDFVKAEVQAEYDKVTNFLNGIKGADGDIKALNNMLNQDLQRMQRNVKDKIGVKLLKEVFEASSEPEIVQIPTVSAPAAWQPDETKLVQETISAREMVSALQQILLSPGEMPEEEKALKSVYSVLGLLIDEGAEAITKESVDSLIQKLTDSITQLVKYPEGVIPFSKREDNKAVLETQKQVLLKLAVDFERAHEPSLRTLNAFVSGANENDSTPIV